MSIVELNAHLGSDTVELSKITKIKNIMAFELDLDTFNCL